jgi:hypothetical protein
MTIYGRSLPNLFLQPLHIQGGPFIHFTPNINFPVISNLNIRLITEDNFFPMISHCPREFWSTKSFSFLSVDRWNRRKNINILDDYLWPVIAQPFPTSPYIFQEDNVPCHESRRTNQWNRSSAFWMSTIRRWNFVFITFHTFSIIFKSGLCGGHS